VPAFLRFVMHRWSGDRCPMVASSLTFTTLLALTPIFAISVALLSSMPFFEDVMVQVKIFLLVNLVPEIAGKIITEYMTPFARNAHRLTTLGVFVLLVTAIALMLTIDRSFNAIWRVQRRRPYWLTLVVYLFLMLAGPLLIGMGVSITTYVMTLSAGIGVPQFAHPVLLRFIPLCFTAIAFFLLYRLIPHHAVPWRDAAVGGIVAAVLFETAKELFAVYVRYGPTYNVLYGAFAALPFFLLWIYLSWLVVLFGAELTASIEERRIRP
jgi:membrane protein